jgi:hypothetical protein
LLLETINSKKKGFIFHPSFYAGYEIRDEKMVGSGSWTLKGIITFLRECPFKRKDRNKTNAQTTGQYSLVAFQSYTVPDAWS